MTTTTMARHTPTMAMGTLEDPAELGRVLAASGYFADAREAAQAVVKVLAGAELGFGPIASMTGVYIVKGRVTLSANLMAAAIKRHPRYDYRIAEHSDAKASVRFFEIPTKAGEDWTHVGTSDFSMDDAKRAGLAGGENWRKYPSNMLLWRAMSNGAKFFCPDAFAGAPIYTPDELGADVDGETGDVVEIAPPASAVTTPMPAPQAVTSDPPPAADRPGDASENAAPSVPAAEPTREDVSAMARAAPADTTPPADNGAAVTNDERAKLAELLDAVDAPDSFRRMALMSYGVESFSDLTRHQAREVMQRAVSRFGSSEGKA